MEQLIAEVEAFATRADMKPQLVLKRAAGYGWSVWDAWKSGESQCTLATAEKIRKYIQNHTPSRKSPEGASCLPATHGDGDGADQVAAAE